MRTRSHLGLCKRSRNPRADNSGVVYSLFRSSCVLFRIVIFQIKLSLKVEGSAERKAVPSVAASLFSFACCSLPQCLVEGCRIATGLPPGDRKELACPSSGLRGVVTSAFAPAAHRWLHLPKLGLGRPVPDSHPQCPCQVESDFSDTMSPTTQGLFVAANFGKHVCT